MSGLINNQGGRTQPVRLDRALEAVARAERQTPSDPARRAMLERFGLSEREVPERDALRPENLRDDLLDFIMPLLDDPTILGSERYPALLESLDEGLSSLAEQDADLVHWGRMVVRHEARKFNALLEALSAAER